MARIDKFLWCVRLYKTRSLAAEAIKQGRVEVNGQVVKPAHEVGVGQVIRLRKDAVYYSYKVKASLENRVGAKLVEQYIANVTEPEELEKAEMIALSRKLDRDRGTGRPTKKERRTLDQWKNPEI